MNDERLRADERNGRLSGAPEDISRDIRNKVRAGQIETGFLRVLRGSHGRLLRFAKVMFVDETHNITLPHIEEGQWFDHCYALDLLNGRDQDGFHFLTESHQLMICPEGERYLSNNNNPGSCGIINYEGRARVIRHAGRPAHSGHVWHPEPSVIAAETEAGIGHERPTYVGSLRAIVNGQPLSIRAGNWHLDGNRDDRGSYYIQRDTATLCSETRTPLVTREQLAIPATSRFAREQYTTPSINELEYMFDEEGQRVLQEAPRTALEGLIRSTRQP